MKVPAHVAHVSRLHRYGKNTALLAPWSVVLENTVDCGLLHDFLVFVHLAVFRDHGGTEETGVETSVNLTTLCICKFI